MEITFGVADPPIVLTACIDLCGLPQDSVTLTPSGDAQRPATYVDPTTGDTLVGDDVLARYLLRLHPTAPLSLATFPHPSPDTKDSTKDNNSAPSSSSSPSSSSISSSSSSSSEDILVHAAEIDQWTSFAASRVHRGVDLASLQGSLSAVDAHLALRTFLVSHSLSLADVSLWGRLALHRSGKQAMRGLSHLSRWFAHIDAMPFAARARRAASSASRASNALDAAAAPVSGHALFSTLGEAVARALRAEGVPESLCVPGNVQISVPPPAKSGATVAADYCFGAFKFAKPAGTNPPQLAAKLAGSLPAHSAGLVSLATAAGPYVNLSLSPHAIAAAAVGDFLAPRSADAAREARLAVKPAKDVVLEYSSPNSNKPQHLGHVRNNAIGSSMVHLLRWRGDAVNSICLVNDRGVHICKSMLAWKLFGNGETPESSGIKGDHLVGKYYVEFETRFRAEYAAWLATDAARERCDAWWSAPEGRAARDKLLAQKEKVKKVKDEAKRAQQLADLDDRWKQFQSLYKDQFFNNESALGRQAKDMLIAWENQDEEVRKLWREMNSWVLAGFKETYARLGCEFSTFEYESINYVLGKEIVHAGLESGKVIKLANGAAAVPFKDLKLPGDGNKVLLRGDGTSIYTTQDLGTAVQRLEKYKADRMIYVVATEQDDHFRALFALLRHLSPELAGDADLHHLSYGMVNLPTGRMKSREGTVVDADDIITELTDLAAEQVRERFPELTAEQVSTRAHAIGLAALKFFMLGVPTRVSIAYDPSKALDFTGRTGPYVLYAYARICSLLAKCGLPRDPSASSAPAFDPLALAHVETDLERGVCVALLAMRPMVEEAALQCEPSKAAEAVYALAKAFNTFYNDKGHPIASCEDEGVKAARIALARATAVALREGLATLGIDVISEM